MIEHGTVVGNVSRSHRPCGACAELVETCEHIRRTGRDARRVRLTPEQQRVRDAGIRALRRLSGEGW